MISSFKEIRFYFGLLLFLTLYVTLLNKTTQSSFHIASAPLIYLLSLVSNENKKRNIQKKMLAFFL